MKASRFEYWLLINIALNSNTFQKFQIYILYIYNALYSNNYEASNQAYLSSFICGLFIFQFLLLLLSNLFLLLFLIFFIFWFILNLKASKEEISMSK